MIITSSFGIITIAVIRTTVIVVLLTIIIIIIAVAVINKGFATTTSYCNVFFFQGIIGIVMLRRLFKRYFPLKSG